MINYCKLEVLVSFAIGIMLNVLSLWTVVMPRVNRSHEWMRVTVLRQVGKDNIILLITWQ